MLVTDIMADVITSGMVKKKRIGQSAAKALGDKSKVQRLEGIISIEKKPPRVPDTLWVKI
jgi:hypothetical protein